MANKIFTPVTLWQNVDVNFDGEAEIVSEEVIDEVKVKKIYFNGRTTEKNHVVRIFGVLCTPINYEGKNVVIANKSIKKASDYQSLIYLTKIINYSVFYIDIAGINDDGEYTKYPDEIIYANLSENKGNLMNIPEDSTKCCWYEWILDYAYAIDYLFDAEKFEKVALLGIGEGANIFGVVAALDKRISATCLINGAGWDMYKGKFKYATDSVPEFNENVYRWLSSYDVQTYAKFIETPVIMVSATNYRESDADRAYDTYIRLPNTENKLMNYVIGSDGYIDNKAIKSMKTFLAKYLKNEDIIIPNDVELTADVVNGEIKIYLKYSDKVPIKRIKIFACEGMLDPALRDWTKISQDITENGEYTYLPNVSSSIAFFIANIEYENGIVLSSNILAKKFNKEEIAESNRDRIIYNSIFTGFFPFIPDIKKENYYTSFIKIAECILLQEGPFNIKGLSSMMGLKTFKINDKRHKPKDDETLMMDVYCKNPCTVTVRFTENLYKENQKEYYFKQTIDFAGIWKNIIVDLNKCYSEDRQTLTSYKDINAITFSADDGNCIFNNILWI